MCSVRTVISIYQRPNGRVPIYKEGNKTDHSSTNATNGCQSSRVLPFSDISKS